MIKMPKLFIWMKLIIIIIIIIIIIVKDMLHGLKKTQYMPAANA
jgi:hypothetical protein